METGESDEAAGNNFRLSDVIAVIENDLENDGGKDLPVDDSMTMPQASQQSGLSSDVTGLQDVGPGTCIQIIEQPASQEVRFRYECEGRSAGSIPGVNSTSENKTYPTIKINGFRGRVVVVVSCVTKESPYRPHPHKLVGKEGCKRGICTVEVNNDSMTASFPNLGIQCIKRKDMIAALDEREKANVDPFKTGFSHRNHVNNIDLNVVRFCFQAFIKTASKYVILPPVVSEPIYDKKAISNLTICRLSHASASVWGGTEVILLCEKVTKDDIEVWIYEKSSSGDILWEEKTDFQPQDVHKQVAIPFRTPRYKSLQIDFPVEVWIELRRPSDNATSEPRPFQLTPMDTGRLGFSSSLRDATKRSLLMNYFQKRIEAKPQNFSGSLKVVEKMTIPNDGRTPTPEITNNNVNNIVGINGNLMHLISESEPYKLESHTLVVSNLTKDNIAESINSLKLGGKQFDDSEIALDNVYQDRNANFFFNSLSEETIDVDDNVGGDIEDFDIYSSMHLAMKNPIDFSSVSQVAHDTSYEDVVPPRPSSETKSVVLAKLMEDKMEEEEAIASSNDVPPLPPKRVKKNASFSKSLPSAPEKQKMSLFHKLFSPKKKIKNPEVGEREGGYFRESSVGGISGKTASELDLNFDDNNLTEAEHYALYTAVAPHANMSEFDELSIFYSPVEGLNK